jgi:hypothetical protein
MKEYLDELLDIYSETGFRATVDQDLNDGSVWFNLREFAKIRDVDGVKVLCIFCRDKRTQVLDVGRARDERPLGIHSQGGVLFLRADEVSGAYKSGSPLRLEGRLYTVEQANLLQDYVWRVVLEANDS